MNDLEVHLLVGDVELLTPELVQGQLLASLFGAEFQCVPAYWLSSRCGRYTHNFLADDVEDGRIEVFASSLVMNYVRGPHPFLIIPSLIDEPMADSPDYRKAWSAVLVALATEIRAIGGDYVFYLHLLTAPSDEEASMRLNRLRAWIENLGLRVQLSEDAIKKLTSDTQNCASLARNYLSGQLATTIAKRCEHSGFTVSSMDLLKKLACQYLDRWAEIGLRPSLSLDNSVLEHMADTVISQAIEPCNSTFASK